MQKESLLTESDLHSRRILRARAICYVLTGLMFMAAIGRIYVSPSALWKVAMLTFICMFPMRQIYQFLANEMMMSRFGRRLESNSDNKTERISYFVVHAVIVFAGIYFLVSGKTALGIKLF